MDAGLHGEAVTLHERSCDGSHEFGALRVVELMGQRDFELASDGGVFAPLCRFGRGPQLRRGERPIRRLVGSHAACLNDAAATAIVVALARSFIDEQQTGAIGGRCGR